MTSRSCASGIARVADEVHAPDLDLRVFADVEPDVDGGRGVALDLVGHLGHVEALLDVQVLDLLDVLLQLREIEDLLLLDVEDLVDLRQRHLFVARDVNLLDRGLLAQHEGDGAARLALRHLDLHVVEVAHLPDRADVLADRLLRQRHAGSGLEVDLDRVVLDLAVAAELQLGDAQAGRRRRRRLVRRGRLLVRRGRFLARRGRLLFLVVGRRDRRAGATQRSGRARPRGQASGRDPSRAAVTPARRSRRRPCAACEASARRARRCG